MKSIKSHWVIPLQYTLILLLTYLVRSGRNEYLATALNHLAYVFNFFWSGLAAVSITELLYRQPKAKGRNDYWGIVIIITFVFLLLNLMVLGIGYSGLMPTLIAVPGTGLITVPGLIISNALTEYTFNKKVNLLVFLCLALVPVSILYYFFR